MSKLPVSKNNLENLTFAQFSHIIQNSLNNLEDAENEYKNKLAAINNREKQVSMNEDNIAEISEMLTRIQAIVLEIEEISKQVQYDIDLVLTYLRMNPSLFKECACEKIDCRCDYHMLLELIETMSNNLNQLEKHKQEVEDYNSNVQTFVPLKQIYAILDYQLRVLENLEKQTNELDAKICQFEIIYEDMAHDQLCT